MIRAASIIGLAAGAALLAGCASSGQAQRGSARPSGTLVEAATTPLADINIRRVHIPDVLTRAQANIYDPRNMGECRSIAAEVKRLDDALGPDADEPPPPPGSREDQAHSVAVMAVREGVSSAVPFRGWIRQLSGAARQQKAVQDAINAGSIRRGYLKGVGMRLNCAPPAAPSWFKPVRAASRPPARPAAPPARRR
jgi:hypothetical protein